MPALFACTDITDDDSKEVTGVVLSKDKVDLLVGESVTLTAAVMPESLGMGVVWSVLDPQYADVKDGTVTGKSEGVTYVIATSADGSKKAACMVSVNPHVKYSVSIKNGMGLALEAIYGYPGMSVILSAATSDGKTHSLTWSVEDAAAGTISADGVLKLGQSASADPAFAYDVQSYVKVVTEDGYGCKIPIRSSLLKGVKVDDVIEPAGMVITIQESESHLIAAMYQGANEPVAIPADGINLEVSNTAAFSIVKAGSTYTLVTGTVSNVSTKLLASTPGSGEKVEIAEFKIDKTYPIKAQLAYTSSSTLTFTWTEGISAEDDIAKPYTITLYTDEAGTSEYLSYNIPAGDNCWKGRQPKFIFTGLASGTTYWFRVKDTNGADDVESDLISGTTDPFIIVEPGDDPASEGDIILAEDFSELYWMADEVSEAAGYDVGDNSRSTFQDRTVNAFVGTTGQYCSPERLITSQETARKASGLRLGKWAQGYTARLYVGPGYVFLSTYGYGTHLITPKLNNIPKDCSATVEVTIHAAGYKSGFEAVLAVQDSSIGFNAISSGTKTNKDKLDLLSNAQTITYTGGLTTLSEFTVTLEGVKQGDRIAFGPTETAISVGGSPQYVKTNANMMLISDMTIKIIELN